MEEFGYNRSYKAHRFMAVGYPVIGLIGVFVYWMFLVVPSRGSSYEIEFKWWTPLFVIGLIVWAIFEITRAIPIFSFKVRLSEDTIEVGNECIAWKDISNVDFRAAYGQEPAIVIRTSDGHILNIPAAVESYAYVRGMIESHTIIKNTD